MPVNLRFPGVPGPVLGPEKRAALLSFFDDVMARDA